MVDPSPILQIDALPLLLRGGISHYVRPLVEHLPPTAPPSWRLRLVWRLACLPDRIRAYRQYRRRSTLLAADHRLVLRPDRWTIRRWERGLLPPSASDPVTDSVFLATTDLVPHAAAGHPRIGWIVYDLIPLKIPRFFEGDPELYRRHMRACAERCAFIIAISETTKRDIVEELGVPTDRITVIYPGVTWNPNDVCVEPSKENRSGGAGGRERPYVYCAGSLARNKNTDGVLRIFARGVHTHRMDADLILTGKDFCGAAYWARLLADLRIADRVRFAGWLPDVEQARLLSGARMLWQFSWYEGFGLPVLEAAARGVPVLHSNRGALPEILGNPEQVMDPEREAEAAEQAAAAWHDETRLQTWRMHGLRRAALFSWERSAQRLWATVIAT